MKYSAKSITKITFPTFRLAGFVISILLFFVGIEKGSAQVFDGSYSSPDYENAQTILVNADASSTCQVEQIWANRTENSELLLGFLNGNNGTAIFRFYLDTDNNPATGLQTETYDTDYNVGGAELVLEVNVHNGSVTLYRWNGTTLTEDNTGDVQAAIGNYKDNDGKFFEVLLPLSVFDNICLTNVYGVINLARYISFSGGNTNSSVCYQENVGFEIGLGGNLTPETTEVCEGNNSTVLTLKNYKGTIIAWQSSTDNGLTWTNIDDVSDTYIASDLTETTIYRVLVENDNIFCDNGEKVTLRSAQATITVNYNASSIVNFAACDSYTWNGTTYTESGKYTANLETVNGCDSTVTLNLTINNSVETSENIEACESYFWNEITYTESGKYTANLETESGCDSAAAIQP